MKRRHLAGIASLVLLLALPSAVLGSHSWGGYHWARQSNPFNLKTGDNVTSAWDSFLDEAIADWTASSVLNLVEVTGSAKGKNCRPPTGRVEVCNGTYGQNGWLGIAQIWITGGNHITQGSVRNNDTYFNMPQYNSSAWREFVICQEMGDTLGLDHTDENFENANDGSCMDYTNDPDGGPGGASNTDPANTDPNAHDYAQLSTIYQHLDSSTTVGASAPTGAGAAWHAEFGRLVAGAAGHGSSVFVRDLGGGQRLVTLVIWA